MNASWITLLSFVSAFLLTMSLGTLLYEWLFRYRMAVRERLYDLAGDDTQQQAATLFKDFSRLDSEKLLDRKSWEEWLLMRIEQAGLGCTVQQFVWASAASGLLLAMLGSLWTWVLGVAAGVLGALVPLMVLTVRKRSRQRKLSRQLPFAFAMISRAVKAGQTVPSALQIIASDLEPPISTEFARCYEQQNLGISRESALRQLAQRTGIMELQIFVVALLVQARSGGDLVELLDNLSIMIRKRLSLKDRVRALTGEGRMQALVLIVLPIAALLGIVVTAPEYARSLFERPWLLGGTALAQAAGVVWIRKIVNFDF